MILSVRLRLMIDYGVEDYDKEFKKVEENNKKLLSIFENSLKGLSEKTVNLHLSNASLFLDEYFYREGLENPQEGASYIDSFFDFFVRKCLWSSPNTVKQLASSMKKFYKCMYENGIVDSEALSDVLTQISWGLEEWMDESDISEW